MPEERLVQIMDAALVEAARKAGPWLACRPGCTQCCYGVFPISTKDAARLLRGMAELDPDRAGRVAERARRSAARLRRDYPGDTLARVLSEDDAADDEPCPALDPETGLCDLYAARPITCRAFGPAIGIGEGPLAVCELCFDGASDEEIAACSVQIDPMEFEDEGEDTTVAYALAGFRK